LTVNGQDLAVNGENNGCKKLREALVDQISVFGHISTNGFGRLLESSKCAAENIIKRQYRRGQ